MKKINVKTDSYIVYCRCMDDLTKYENCKSCPNYNSDVLKFEDFCKFTKDEEKK